MAALGEAIERAVKRKTSVLILGPARDPQELNRHLQTLVEPQPVSLCNCLDATPQQPELESQLETGLRAGGIVHVAVGTSLDNRLLDTLVSVIADGRLPGRDRDKSLTGVIVLSSTARWASELGGALNEYFPIQVGAAE